MWTATLCGYGRYATIAEAVIASPTSSPRPQFPPREIINGNPDVAGPFFLTLGFLVFFAIASVAYSFWHHRAREEVRGRHCWAIVWCVPRTLRCDGGGWATFRQAVDSRLSMWPSRSWLLVGCRMEMARYVCWLLARFVSRVACRLSRVACVLLSRSWTCSVFA